MNKKISTPLSISIIVVLALAVGGGVFWYTFNFFKQTTEIPNVVIQKPEVKSGEQNNNGITLDQLKNIEYSVDSKQKVILKDGKYIKEYPGLAETFEVGIFNNLIAFGDLNNDGKKDAAVIIDFRSGGTGHFYNISAVINNNGQPESAAYSFLGDRIEISSIKIDGGIIYVDGTFKKDTDGGCCPTDKKIREFKLENNKLIEVVDSSNLPVIDSITPNSGPVGTIIEIKGKNLNGFEGDLTAWIENSKGEKGVLYSIDQVAGNRIPGASTLIRTKIESKLCSEDNSYSGLPCGKYLNVTFGKYKIYAVPWGNRSNEVEFTVTP